jgi:formiminoglutamase
MDNNLDFSILFDQVELDYDWKQSLAQDSTYHSLYVYEESFPDLENIDIALFSVDDNRGSANHVLDVQRVREQYYKLKKGTAHYQIADLGCLKPGPNYSDTILRFKEVLGHLLSQNIFPVLLNCSQDFVHHAYATFIEENIVDKINIGVIDSSLDIDKSFVEEEQFVGKILSHEPNKLERFKLIGYQSYLVNPDIKLVFDKLAFEEIRLGALKKDIMIAEPMLRNCHIVSFDLAAIKSHEFPANAVNNPFGLTVEEACQLTWFTGVSNSLNFFMFSGYREDEDLTGLSSNGMAVQLWYLVEGFYTRVREDLTKEVTEYIVEHQSLSEPLVFVKGKKSGKWWIKRAEQFIPCTYKDYQSTQDGILPEVWLREEWR